MHKVLFISIYQWFDIIVLEVFSSSVWEVRGWSKMLTQWVIIPCPFLNILKVSPAHEAGVNKHSLNFPSSFSLSLHLCPSLPLHLAPIIMWWIQNLSSVSSARNVWRPGHREIKVGNLITLHIICLSDWQKLLTFVAEIFPI